MVRALCWRMLDARAFDALPILADALQDAGCTDNELLAQCQAPDVKPVLAERLVNRVFSDETTAPVRWLEQFVRDINYPDYRDEDDEVGVPSDTHPHDYEYVISAGHQGVTEGVVYFGSDSGADFFRDSADDRRAFFRNWSVVTEVAAPEDVYEQISFSCAC